MVLFEPLLSLCAFFCQSNLPAFFCSSSLGQTELEWSEVRPFQSSPIKVIQDQPREENQNCGQIDNNYIYTDINITASNLVLILAYGDLGQLIVHAHLK